MSTIKLPQFLSRVDSYTKDMTHQQLEELVHEISRTLPEDKRLDLLDTIESFISDSDSKTSVQDDYKDIINDISEVILKLDEISNGDMSLGRNLTRSRMTGTTVTSTSSFSQIPTN